MKPKILILVVLSCFFSSCAEQSGLGLKGSPLWFETASSEEIQKYKSEVHEERKVSGGLVGALFNRKGSRGSEANFEACLKSYSWRCDSSLLTAKQKAEIEAFRSVYSYDSGCAENGSCYGDISRRTGRPKTVRVKGYYRRDGTYVRGHYRSR